MAQFVHFSRMSEQENNEPETASVKGLKFLIFYRNEIFKESFGNNFFHVYKEKKQFWTKWVKQGSQINRLQEQETLERPKGVA